jgi:Rrf2 family protein
VAGPLHWTLRADNLRGPVPWSLTTEYALRAAVSLAAAAPEALTTAQIADDTRIPLGYLSKVLQTLGRASILRGQRGLRGGFTLTRPPDAVTALDVVNAVDPIRRIRVCPLGLARHERGLCPLHHRMDEALAALERVYAGMHLSDMVEASEGPPLCSTPPRRHAKAAAARLHRR